jgi:hypothetical protein
MLDWLLSMTFTVEEKKSYMTIPENTYEDMNLPYDGGLDGYI